MKKLLAVLLATTTMSIALSPQAYAQALTAEQAATFATLNAAGRAALLASLGLTPQQVTAMLSLDNAAIEKILSLPTADFLKVAALPADVLANVGALPIEAMQVVAALPANELSAVASLPAAQLEAVVALPEAERAEIFTAVTELKESAVGGDGGAIAANIGRLNDALAALPVATRADFAVAVGTDLQEAVADLPSDSSIRSVVSSAIGGVAQIVVANGGDADQVETLTTAATNALQDAPAGENIGAVQENPAASGTNAG